jgi:hypothetical protein
MVLPQKIDTIPYTHKVLDSIVKKIQESDYFDISWTDQQLCEHIIDLLRIEKIAPLEWLERLMNRPVRRDDIKDISYQDDAWWIVFNDLKNEKTYVSIREVIFDQYKYMFKRAINIDDKDSLLQYQKRCDQHNKISTQDQFLKSIADFSRLVQNGQIVLNKNYTLHSFAISNQELQKALVDRKIIQPWEFTDYINQVNSITDSSHFAAFQDILSKQLKAISLKIEKQSEKDLIQIDNCFHLPTLGDLITTYQTTPTQVVQWWIASGGLIDDIIWSGIQTKAIKSIVTLYHNHNSDISKLAADDQYMLYTWIYEQLSDASKLLATVYYISSVDPLLWWSLIALIKSGDIAQLTINQKQVILDRLKVIRLSPKVEKTLNEWMKTDSNQYKWFVDQIFELSSMTAVLKDPKNKYSQTIDFVSKDLVVQWNSSFKSLQDMQDLELTFACSMTESFEPIYKNRFVWDRIYGRHHHPVFFNRQWQELQEWDLITIKWNNGQKYTGYPQATLSTQFDKWIKKVDDRDDVWYDMALDLYQQPPNILPRTLLLHIPSSDLDLYQIDTNTISNRQFYLQWPHDLKGLLLLFPMYHNALSLWAKGIQELSGTTRWKSFQSRFKKDHISGATIDSWTSEAWDQNHSSATPNIYQWFLKSWQWLGWDTSLAEPKVWDLLYFAHGTSALPKLPWYFKWSWFTGRGDHFWTKFKITSIDHNTWVMTGEIRGVEQSLWTSEWISMTINMTASAIDKLSKNFPAGIVKVKHNLSSSHDFETTLIWSQRWGNTLPKYFNTPSSSWWQGNISWFKNAASSDVAQIVNFKNRTKKRYVDSDAKTAKATWNQWEDITHFGIAETVLNVKWISKYTALMYKVQKAKNGVYVSMENPIYKKFMTWDDFLIFVLDKWLKPFHQQDIEALKTKVDIVAMEEDDERSWAKKKWNITGFAPIDTHPSLKPVSPHLWRFVSRNSIVWWVKKLWHDVQHHYKEADEFRQKRVEYMFLNKKLWSRFFGKLRPPIGHLFSEMEGEGDFWALDEMITKQIEKSKAELDAKVTVASKVKQIKEVLDHWSHLTTPSWYQFDRERLKACGYLLRCLESGWPYNRALSSVAPKDGKRVATILWKNHVALYKKHFAQRKVEREQNPNAESLSKLNVAEMDYIFRTIDGDEQQKLIFGTNFKWKLEMWYKNDSYKKWENIQKWRDSVANMSEFTWVYDKLKGDNVAKDLFEWFMWGMRHAAWLIKNSGFKTDQYNMRTGLLLWSMFSGWTLFRWDDFSQTHHFWKLWRDFGIHPITAQMLVDKKTWWSAMMSHIFDKICELEGIESFTKSTGWDRAKLGPWVAHSERLSYTNKFIARWSQYADTIMPYMQLNNTNIPGKNLLEMQDDPIIKSYISTFLREDKSPVDIESKWHVDPTVFNYTPTGTWSFPKGMMVNQMLKFDDRWNFDWSAGEQNSSYFWNYLWKAIEDMWSANMSDSKYNFVMQKIFTCFGERFDNNSKATFLNALRLLKLWWAKNCALAEKLLYTCIVIHFQERLFGPLPSPVEETLKKFVRFVTNHTSQYCSDDLVTQIFHYDKSDKDNIDTRVSRVDQTNAWFYEPRYYKEKLWFSSTQMQNLAIKAEQNIEETLRKYKAKHSNIVTVEKSNKASNTLADSSWHISEAIQRKLPHPFPGPNKEDISKAISRNWSDMTEENNHHTSDA